MLVTTAAVIDLLCAGFTPFEVDADGPADEIQQTYNRIINSQLYFPDSDSIGTEAIEFMKDLLVVDPSKRLGSDERSIREHSWFQQPVLRWDMLEAGKVSPPFVPPRRELSTERISYAKLQKKMLHARESDWDPDLRYFE